MMRKWARIAIFRLLLAIDQLANAILLGFPDESISGRVGRAIASGRPKDWVRPIRDILDYVFLKLFNDPDHCNTSQEPEERFEERYEIWCWYHLNEEDRQRKAQATR